jgi:tetratricopeptide (TPR) repeat protein
MSLPDLTSPLSHLEAKNLEAAVEALEHKVEALPMHLGAHVLLAYAYEAQRRWDEALASWTHAQVLLPNSPLAAAGKQRTLRHLNGREGTGHDAAPPAQPPRLSPNLPALDAEPDAPADDDDLAALRRQADHEARRGGARPGLAGAPSTPTPDDLSPTPEEQVERLTDDDADDLDHLIDQLQSARINPEPEAPDQSRAEPPTAPSTHPPDDTDEVVSETLARIHAGQQDYPKAARIYEQLAEQDPERAAEFRDKAAEMRDNADPPPDSDPPDSDPPDSDPPGCDPPGATPGNSVSR